MGRMGQTRSMGVGQARDLLSHVDVISSWSRLFFALANTFGLLLAAFLSGCSAPSPVVVSFGNVPAAATNAEIDMLNAALTAHVPLAGAGTDKPRAGSTYANDGSILGTNLSAISDWSPEWAFVDCFKASRDWISGTTAVFQDTTTLTLDTHGWVTSLKPGQVAKSLLFWEQAGTYPSGDYVVLYDGEGALEYRDAANKGQSAPGRDVIHVDASKGGWELWITQTNPANYIRNIRVIMPGGGSLHDPYSWWATASVCPYADFQPFEQTYATLRFHPAFLNTVKNYKVLRFMDWMATNNSAQQNWADRPTLADARWTSKGVPVEVLCALANTLHADPWFCMPHLATDDYTQRFATAVRDQLAPDLHAYIEYSNEVWNSMFSQQRYASAQGLALGLSTDQYKAVPLYTAYRSLQMFMTFEQVFGGTGRLKRVLATQAANSYMGEMELTSNNAYQQADVLAIAPYFGGEFGDPAHQTTTKALSVDQLFAAITATSLPAAYALMKANADLAKKHGITLVAYEGGQSLVGYSGTENNDAISALFDAANRDPRMGAIYADYLNTWKSYGGGTFVHYLNCLNYGKWGRWGSLERLDQPASQAPKYAALQQFIESNR